jgi:ribosome-associated translation inhibitor RaiA
LLNGDISGLEEAIVSYGRTIDAAEKPINKKSRKMFDKMNQKILAEIARIEANLEKYKDTDPEKYEEESNRLNACKEKLEAINKKYRSKYFLTKSGKRVKDALDVKISDVVADGGIGLTEEEREAFYSALQKIVDNLENISRKFSEDE